MRRTPSDNRFLISMGGLALFLGLSSGIAFAAEPDRERTARARVEVLEVTKLQPQSGSEVIVPDFKASFLSDGSVTISGKASARAGAPAQGFDFEVDLENRTYKTRRLDAAEIAERDRSRRTPPRSASSEEQPLEKAVANAIRPGDWRGRVRVQTKDPVFIVLTETMASVNWRVSSTGAVTALSHSDYCWAANPSSLGTHWYVDFCLYGAPYMNAGRACNANRGDYYNYDYLIPTWETTVVQTAYICGRNDAVYDVTWSHNDAGEDSLLIYGTVVMD